MGTTPISPLLIGLALVPLSVLWSGLCLVQSQQRSRPLKKRAHRASKAKLSQQLLGPKVFPLDRLLAIFYSIVDEDVAVSGEIYTQITALVSLRLLLRTSTEDNLDMPRFKVFCSVAGVCDSFSSVSVYLFTFFPSPLCLLGLWLGKMAFYIPAHYISPALCAGTMCYRCSACWDSTSQEGLPRASNSIWT